MTKSFCFYILSENFSIWFHYVHSIIVHLDLYIGNKAGTGSTEIALLLTVIQASMAWQYHLWNLLLVLDLKVNSTFLTVSKLWLTCNISCHWNYTIRCMSLQMGISQIHDLRASVTVFVNYSVIKNNLLTRFLRCTNITWKIEYKEIY